MQQLGRYALLNHNTCIYIVADPTPVVVDHVYCLEGPQCFLCEIITIHLLIDFFSFNFQLQMTKNLYIFEQRVTWPIG